MMLLKKKKIKMKILLKNEIGLYFQWGDTQGYTINQIGNGTGQKLFTDETYKYVTSVWNEDWGSYEPIMTKYTSTEDDSNADDLIILELYMLIFFNYHFNRFIYMII